LSFVLVLGSLTLTLDLESPDPPSGDPSSTGGCIEGMFLRILAARRQKGTRMQRAVRPIVLLAGVVTLLLMMGELARAEEGQLRTLLLVPLKGPGGAVARNNIRDAIGDRAVVKLASGAAAQRPAQAARTAKADAIIGGFIRCPNKQCRVDVIVYEPSGKVWQKATGNAGRNEAVTKAAELAESVLSDLDLLYVEPEPEATPEPAPEAFEFDTYNEDDEEEDDDGGSRRRRRRDRDRDRDREEDADEEDDEGSERRHKAIEVYLDMDLTLVRNLCLDMIMGGDEDDSSCDLNQPSADDRTYTITPFASLGLRLYAFPGAFFRNDDGEQGWYSHIGLYFDYGHSLSLNSQREYEFTDGTRQVRRIDSSQQDLRVGLVGRIPFGSVDRPQLRILAGFGWFDFFVDDTDYPIDEDINQDYRDSNPYLPAFTYSSFDVGLDFRVPIRRGMLWPYTSLMYRIGLGAGQADEILGTDSTINGVDWEIGLHVELAYGIRIAVAMQLVWYGITFDGNAPDLAGSLWEGTFPGNTADDLILRLRLGVGWAF
jgi:hypothetical protein